MGEVNNGNDKANEKADNNARTWSDLAYGLIGAGCGAACAAAAEVQRRADVQTVAGIAAGAAAGVIGAPLMLPAYEAGRAAATGAQEAAKHLRPVLNEIPPVIPMPLKEFKSGTTDAMINKGPLEQTKAPTVTAKDVSDLITTVTNEIKTTPSDVVNHIQKRPLTAAAEILLCPPLVIIDAKFHR